MKKKWYSVFACLLVFLMLVGCGSSKPAPADDATDKPDTSETTAQNVASQAEERIKMTLMIENPSNSAFIPQVEEMLIEKFPEVEFVFKPWNTNDAEKTIKTAFAGGEAIDLALFWPNQMATFVGADMALDLTPYLDADPEWKNSFIGDSLNTGTIDGKVWAIPYNTVYGMMQVNMDLLEEAGVEYKPQWTWDEFVDACEKIVENTDAFPFAIPGEWACWFTRDAFLQIWDDTETVDKFNNGEISFTDPRLKEAFDKIAALYHNNYCYPGESALTSTPDQATAAFVQGKAAILCNVNLLAPSVATQVGDAFEIGVLTWPNIGSPEMNYMQGGCDGYMITSNTKYPDKAVEIMKFLTSPEVMQVKADNGVISTVAGVTSSDPNAAQYGRDASMVYPGELLNLSPEMFDYITISTPANYILYGESSLEELEEIRLAALED